MNKTNFQFLVLQENVIDKSQNLIKENQSYKNIIRIVCKDRMWVSTALLLFWIPIGFLVLSFHLEKFPNFRAKKFNTLCTNKICSYRRNMKLVPLF